MRRYKKAIVLAQATTEGVDREEGEAAESRERLRAEEEEYRSKRTDRASQKRRSLQDGGTQEQPDADEGAKRRDECVEEKSASKRRWDDWGAKREFVH